MKILHTADWHFGIDLYKKSLLQDQEFFIDQLLSIVENEHIDIILISGDIYDTTLASKEAIELYNKVMTMLCLKLKKKVVVIAGNHDSPTRLAACAALLAPMGLYVIGKIEKPIQGIRFDDVIIYPIPYFHLDTIRHVYGKNIEHEQNAFEEIVAHIRKQKDETCTHIIMAHTFMAGANVCESDRFANVGGADLISSEVFDEFDYVALGHLHRHQKVGKHAYYSGSPLAYSFSEAGQKKCVLIYDTITKAVQEIAIQPLHELKIMKGSFEEIQQRMHDEQEEHEAYIKIEVEDTIVSYEMLDYFRQHYDNLLQLSGKGNVHDDTSITLQLEDLDRIQDIEIVKQFFHDYYAQELQETEIKLFEEAKAASERNDEECVH